MALNSRDCSGYLGNACLSITYLGKLRSGENRISKLIDKPIN